jgi:hypothetical protein
MDVLYVTLDRRSVGCPRQPQVQVFMSASFEIECVVTRVQVGKLVDKMEG